MQGPQVGDDSGESSRECENFPFESFVSNEYFQGSSTRAPTLSVTGNLNLALNVNATLQVLLMRPDNRDKLLAVFTTLLAELNLCLPTDTDSIWCYYGSAIVTTFPDLADPVIDLLRRNNIDVKDAFLPSQPDEYVIPLAESASFNDCLILMAQLLLIPYKNLTSAKYYQFMKKQIEALKSFIGGHPDEPRLMAIADLENVTKIKSIFGCDHAFRVSLLRKIKQGTTSEISLPISPVCSYVSKILNYTEMSAFRFVDETIVTFKSQVLCHPRVHDEVRNLAAAAYYAFKRSVYPQFFRILAPYEDGKVLERSKFPILVTVAQRLNADVCTNVPQFVAPADFHAPVVEELVNLHNQHESGTGSSLC